MKYNLLKKQLLLWVMVFVGTLNVISQEIDETFQVDGLEYRVTSINPNEVFWVKNYLHKNVKEIAIPNIVKYKNKNFAVVGIGKGAIKRHSLTTIRIPKTIKVIIQDDFLSGCFFLEKIIVSKDNPTYSSKDGVLFNKNKTTLIYYPSAKKTTDYIIPQSVETIQTSFKNNFITTLFVPKSVKEDFIFIKECYNLEKIEVDKDNQYLCSANGILFNKDKTKLIRYPINKKESQYIVPNSVTKIEKRAFGNCNHLTNITLPNSLKKIEGLAFAFCNSLNSINIPNSTTRIEEMAFYFCLNLTSITLPNSLEYIGSNSFTGCHSLTSIFSEIENVQKISIDSYEFRSLYDMCTLFVPKGKAEEYRKYYPWKSFKNIKEEDTSVKTVQLTNPILVVENNITISQVLGKNVRLFDISGKMMYNQRSAKDKLSIEVRKKGTYILQVNSGVRKIIVK